MHTYNTDLTPFVTLFHWETPQAMEDDYESMLSKDFVDDYLNYVDICFKNFGDKVKHWITFNEPSYICKFGYSMGIMPPLRCSSWLQNGCLAGDSSREPYQALHNVILAHASAVHLYRDKYKKSQGGQIGVTLTTTWFLPLDPTSKQDIDACERALQFNLGWFLDPITQGDYPSTMRLSLGDRLSKFYGQGEWIKGTYDFIGVNYYTSVYGQHNPTIAMPGKETYESDMQIISHDIIGYPAGNHPEGIKALLLYIKNNYRNPTIYITENGIKTTNHPEPLPVEEHMNDQIRISYFSNHLTKLKEAIDEGANVKGHTAWSLTDSFEWIFGYTDRYGLIYVDYYDDLKRTPKASYAWFREFLRPLGIGAKAMNENGSAVADVTAAVPV